MRPGVRVGPIRGTTMTTTTDTNRDFEVESPRDTIGHESASTIDCALLGGGISRIASARSFEELGRQALALIQDILAVAGCSSSPIVGLVSDDGLEVWSSLVPERASVNIYSQSDQGSLCPSSIKDLRSPEQDFLTSGDPIKNAVVSTYELGSSCGLGWFLVGDHFFPRGVIAIVSDIPLVASVASCVELVATTTSLALERIQLKGQLRIAEAKQSQLIDQLANASDEERALLAGEIHDGPLQTLSALVYNLQLAGWKAADGNGYEAAEVIDRAEDTLRKEIANLRALMMNLVPPTLSQEGLLPALVEYVHRMSLEYPDLALRIDAPEGNIELPEERGRLLYRIAQEAVCNAVKHARASVIRISLWRRGQFVILSVQDDGVGFDVSEAGRAVLRGHVGLSYMRQRVDILGGRLDIKSSPDYGTSVEVTVEISPTKKPSANGAI
jgi:signal transduction histidine kinase